MAAFKLYSKRAEEIMVAFAGDWNVTRAVDGELMPSIGAMCTIRSRIKALTKADKTPLKRQAKDNRAEMNGFGTFTHDELNLVWQMLEGKEDETSLRAAFGDKLFDYMVGLPRDPITTAKREILLKEIEKAEDEYAEKKAEICRIELEERRLAREEGGKLLEAMQRQVEDLQVKMKATRAEMERKIADADRKATKAIADANADLKAKRLELKRQLGETVGK